MGIEPMNYRPAFAPDYQDCRLIKKSSSYDDDLARESDKMLKQFAVQMKDRLFSWRYRRLVAAF